MAEGDGRNAQGDGQSSDSGRSAARRDPTLAAARYRVDRELGPGNERRAPTADELRSIAKTQLDLAIERGEFDGLPGSGKPLAGLGTGTHDPDWWIKAKIEREGLSGVAPPALSLRTENERFDDVLDATASEASVRAAVAEFTARIVEARRQLTGGPPVVTPTRDPDVEVQRWQDRRARRRAEAQSAAEASAAEQPTSWRDRRRAARAARAAQAARDARDAR